MSPDLKDSESSFKSSPENVLRNRKLNGQRNASDETNDSRSPGDPVGKELAREQSSKSNKVNKSRNSSNASNASDHSLDESLDNPFSFQIRINLPVCCLFAVAFLMRFWLIDYPKSIV